MAILKKILKNPFVGFASPFICRRVAKIRPKEKPWWIYFQIVSLTI
jgi:hypothetical protein